MRKRFKSFNDSSLRCSFCGKVQEQVGKLISSSSDYPRAYICDECIAVCTSIIEDDKPDLPHSEDLVQDTSPHPLCLHPLASDLMEAIERWIREESVGGDSPTALAEMRAIATRMLSATR